MSLTFRLGGSIRMNRPIDTEKDFISPGSFTMVMNGKEVNFDFTEHCGGPSLKDATIYEFEMRNPDYESFPDLETLTIDDLRNVTDIKEVFIYTGEPKETDLAPAKVLGLSFLLPYESCTEIIIPSEVIQNAKCEH